MTLFYLPLEPYEERYTSQLSARDVGWYERNWKAAGVDYVRVEGLDSGDRHIRKGEVLDATGRGMWGCSQVHHLLLLMREGKVKSGDVLFLDDFWTPGFMAVPYALAQLGLDVKCYAQCWAQSVDEYDFTHKWVPWIRPFEYGIGGCLDGVFVASTELGRKLVATGVCNAAKVHVTGLPFDSYEVLSRCPEQHQAAVSGGWPVTLPRQDRVVFSSRWDREKQPFFFLQVIQRIIEEEGPNAPQFVVCTSRPQITSNSELAVSALRAVQFQVGDRLVVKEGLTKDEYYALLCGSKVQFNCALQDWVSFTLLEASVCGCHPVYPNFRGFPEVFHDSRTYMYEAWNVEDAARSVMWALRQPDSHWSSAGIRDRRWIHQRYDSTWRRQLHYMGIPTPGQPPTRTPYTQERMPC